MTDTVSTPPDSHYAKIGIVGFGAVGASILAQQVTEIEHLITADPEHPPLVEFKIYNEGQDHGHGQAYDLHKMAFCLNFPAHCQADDYNVPLGMNPAEIGMVGMHLLDGKHSDLVDYIEERRTAITPEMKKAVHARFQSLCYTEGMTYNEIAYDDPDTYRDFMLTSGNVDQWGPNSYLPRAFYREYLLDIFQRTKEHIAKINDTYGYDVIRVSDCVDGHVSGIACGEDLALSITCDTANGANPAGILTDSVDSVVIATGHHYGPLFDHVNMEESFTNTPFGDTEIEDALGERDYVDAVVTIIGTGASYLDVLRNLDALDYDGKIVALSSSPTHYWPFDPRKNGRPYDISRFMEATHGLPLKEIKERLVQKLHSEEVLHVGPQNFFVALKQHMADFEDRLGPDSFKDFQKFFDKLAWNRTAPESYEVFRRFQDSGQLTFESGRMSEIHFDSEEARWETTLTNGKVLYSDIVCDCAGLATRVVGPKGEIYDPLIRNLVEDSRVAVADIEKGVVLCADTNLKQVAFAGVAGSNDRGLPFTRQLFRSAAQPTLEVALQRAKARREAELAEPAPAVYA